MELSPPLGEYALIGDTRTAALVHRNGSVDWWCPGRFDAPSACARLLDPERGGHFTVKPAGDADAPRVRYDGDSNVLRTEWLAAGGRLVVHDLMPIRSDDWSPAGPSRILRLVECTAGRVDVDAVFAPRPQYGRHVPDVAVERDGARLTAPASALAFATRAPVEEAGPGAVRARVALGEGEAVAFAAYALADEDARVRAPTVDEARDALRVTRDRWEAWAHRSPYQGPYRDEVMRSTLVLKALDHEGGGGLVAAPTTSLPEDLGGERNWDYRFVWLRDAALAVSAFHQSGHADDAVGLAHWAGRVLERTKDPADLRVTYRVDGSPSMDERELPHLAGYASSRPVRVGNEAVHQWQLDVYGELVDVLHLCRTLGSHEEEVEWDRVRALVEYVRKRWREPDRGIWEFRAPPRHFVVSKVLAWVALDRGVRGVEELGLDGPVDAWREAREEVRRDVLERGVDESRGGAFVQSYGDDALDAATLLVPIVGFLHPTDYRVEATVDAVMSELTENGLVHRYRGVDDGLPGTEGAFAICSCWLAEVLAEQGRVDEAREVLDALLRHASPLGLLSEQVHPRTGRLLGNYPQGLTHIGIVNAAAAIARMADGGGSVGGDVTRTAARARPSGPSG